MKNGLGKLLNNGLVMVWTDLWLFSNFTMQHYHAHRCVVEMELNSTVYKQDVGAL